MGRDVVADAPVLASVDAPIVVVAADSLAASPAPAQEAPAAAAPAPPPAARQPSQRQVWWCAIRHPRPGNALRTWIRGVQRSLAPSAPAAIVALVPEAASEQWARVAITFPRGTYALDPDGTAEPRVRAASDAGVIRARVGAQRPARGGCAPEGVDLCRHLHLSVGQRDRQGARARSGTAPASTCCSARTRITTASAIR